MSTGFDDFRPESAKSEGERVHLVEEWPGPRPFLEVLCENRGKARGGELRMRKVSISEVNPAGGGPEVIHQAS